MFKQNVKFTDYNGVDRETDCYFSLSEVELTELEFGVEGGYGAMVQKIIENKDNAAFIRVLKDLVHKSYGVKSDDGMRFIKNEKVLEEFTQSPAYSELFMMLLSDEKKATDFMNNIIPAKIKAKAEAMAKQSITVLPSNK